MLITKEVIVLYTDDGMGNSIGEIVGEVVRCKDCKYYGDMKAYNMTTGETMLCCSHNLKVVKDGMGFCSWGERREDGNKPKSI